MSWNKRVLKTIAALTLIGGMWLVVRHFVLGVPVVTHAEANIAFGNIQRPFDKFFVHTSEQHFIRVGRKLYQPVKGMPPYYLKLTQLKSILFVTDEGYNGLTFHIVRVADGRETAIYSDRMSFGVDIGGRNSPGEPYTDFVEKEAPESLVLASQYPHAKTRVYLDLRLRKVTKVEYEEHDESGRCLVKHTYINGKRIE